MTTSATYPWILINDAMNDDYRRSVIGTALYHAAIIEDVNLLHQPPAPRKRLQPVFATRAVPDILLIGPVFHQLDIQFDPPILPVSSDAGYLVVGLNGIDHDNFKPW